MNNLTKAAVILLGLIGLMVIGVQIWQQVTSYTEVVFKFDLNEGEAKISSNNTPKITVKNNQTLRLKQGDYRIETSGNNIQPDTTFITIDKTTTNIEVKFSYSQDYLKSLLNDQQSEIEEVIAAKYPTINSLYTLHNQALYHHGEYYGATLRFKDQTSDQRDTLHILAQKNDNSWQIISNPPSPVLSAPDYPNIPKEILRQINLGE